MIIHSLEDAETEVVEEARKKHLTESGVTTPRDELAQIGKQLRDISERLQELELR